MTYDKKLFIAKILLSLSAVYYALSPVFVDLGPAHMTSDAWAPHARFHVTWTLINHLLVLPVLLYILWSKLHGTGRSVRIIAFLGLAYSVSFYLTTVLAPRLGAALQDDGHAHIVLGVDANTAMVTVNFILIIIATVLSLKPRKLHR